MWFCCFFGFFEVVDFYEFVNNVVLILFIFVVGIYCLDFRFFGGVMGWWSDVVFDVVVLCEIC